MSDILPESSNQRAERVIHWTKTEASDETLKEKTRFLYKRGKWIHEPKQPSLRRSKSERITIKSNGDNSSKSLTKKVDSKPITSKDDNSYEKEQLTSDKYSKPSQSSLLSYARRKWTNFTDLLKKDASAAAADDVQTRVEKIVQFNEESIEIPNTPLEDVESRQTFVHVPPPQKPPRPKREAATQKSSSSTSESDATGGKDDSIDDSVELFEKILQSFPTTHDSKSRSNPISYTVNYSNAGRTADFTQTSDFGQSNSYGGKNITSKTDLMSLYYDRKTISESNHCSGQGIRYRNENELIYDPQSTNNRPSPSGEITSHSLESQKIYERRDKNATKSGVESQENSRYERDCVNIHEPGDRNANTTLDKESVTVEKLDLFTNGEFISYETIPTCNLGFGAISLPSNVTIEHFEGDRVCRTIRDDLNKAESNHVTQSETERLISSETYRGSPITDSDIRIKDGLFYTPNTDTDFDMSASFAVPEDDTDLRIIEDGDCPAQSTDRNSVRRQKDYRSRRIRFTGPDGDFHQTTKTLSNSKTESIHRAKESGGAKVAVLKKCLEIAQLKKEAIVGSPRKIEQISKEQRDLAASRRELTLNSYIGVDKKEKKSVGNIFSKFTKPKSDSLQVTRMVSETNAVVENVNKDSSQLQTISLDKAEITIPNGANTAQENGKSATISQQQSSPTVSPTSASHMIFYRTSSSSDESANVASSLGSRYRVIENIQSVQNREWRSDQTIDESAVTDTERTVLLAAIEGRLMEKENGLFNPNVSQSTDPHQTLASAQAIASSLTAEEKTKIPSREEEEVLARARILAQANTGLGARAMLRKRNLIVDEETLEELFLRCVICHDRYNEKERSPKLLPCHHTFCLQCLKEMFRVEAEHRQSLTTAFQHLPSFVSINCPTCRENHMINDSNYSHLKSDQKILELLEISSSSQREIVGYCSKHRTQTLDYFCESCVTSICGDCRVLDHNKENSHTVYSRDEAMKRYSERVRITCAKAKTEEEILGEIEKNLESAIANVDSNLQRTVADVERIFDNFRTNINTRQDFLLACLQEELGKTQENYSLDLDSVTQRINALDKTRTSVLQAKELEDVEQMFVNQRTGRDILNDPFVLVSDSSKLVKTAFSYDKRDRANIMSTISDHGILTIES